MRWQSAAFLQLPSRLPGRSVGAVLRACLSEFTMRLQQAAGQPERQDCRVLWSRGDWQGKVTLRSALSRLRHHSNTAKLLKLELKQALRQSCMDR